MYIIMSRHRIVGVSLCLAALRSCASGVAVELLDQARVEDRDFRLSVKQSTLAGNRDNLFSDLATSRRVSTNPGENCCADFGAHGHKHDGRAICIFVNKYALLAGKDRP
jgi:hypothetical protein